MSNRTDRANAEIQRALTKIIDEKLNDPRLMDIITVTNVMVSADFNYCKVFVSILSDNKDERDKIFSILKGCLSFIRWNLCQMVKMPAAPKLTLILDEGAIHSDRINEILKNLDKKD